MRVRTRVHVHPASVRGRRITTWGLAASRTTPGLLTTGPHANSVGRAPTVGKHGRGSACRGAARRRTACADVRAHSVVATCSVLPHASGVAAVSEAAASAHASAAMSTASVPAAMRDAAKSSAAVSDAAIPAAVRDATRSSAAAVSDARSRAAFVSDARSSAAAVSDAAIPTAVRDATRSSAAAVPDARSNTAVVSDASRAAVRDAAKPHAHATTPSAHATTPSAHATTPRTHATSRRCSAGLPSAIGRCRAPRAHAAKPTCIIPRPACEQGAGEGRSNAAEVQNGSGADRSANTRVTNEIIDRKGARLRRDGGALSRNQALLIA
jgi:hypothetical protein